MLLLGAEQFSRECHIYFGLHDTPLDWLYNNYFLLAAIFVLLGSLAFNQQYRTVTRSSFLLG